MADTKEKKRLQILQLREALGNGYAFVRGRQYNQSVANITFEELIDQAVDRIEGTAGRSDVRATLLDRVKKIRQEVSSAVDTVKQRPPTDWVIESDEAVDDADNQNTEEAST